MITFSLDYDDTYTEDPELWDRFIDMALSRGHIVTVITSRMENNIEEIRKALPGMEIIATNGRPKREFGSFISVWIDDMPETIVR